MSLYEDVKKKALMRLEFDGLSKCEAITSVGARWFNDPAGEHLDLQGVPQKSKDYSRLNLWSVFGDTL